MLHSRMSNNLVGDGHYDGSLHPVKVKHNLIVDDTRIIGIKDIRNEALRLSLISDSLPTKHSETRAQAHRDFEKQLTRLGLAMGREADRRAKVNEALIASLKQRILAVKEHHEHKMHPHLVAIERLSKLLAQEAEEIVERSKSKPLNRAEDKHYDSIIRKSRIYAAKYHTIRALENILIAKQELMYRLLDFEKNKLAAAYKSVIADIRPVGGSFSMTKFSHQDFLRVMNNTVGKHFPSSWINASNEYSPLVVKKQREGAAAGSYYGANQLFTHENSPMAGMVDRTELGDPESIHLLYTVLSHSDPSISLDSVPFECENDTHQVLLHYDKEFFDPAVHEADDNGLPVGDEWMLNDYPWEETEEDEYPFEEILPLNQWYRKLIIQGENFDVISVEGLQDDHAFHEFSHRAEHVVKNGSINFQEQAFLDRRTKDENGKRLPLIMVDEKGNVMKPFFNIETTFNELNQSVLGDFDEKATDDVFQFPVMEQGDFITTYIGRIYPSGGGREVLAMGAEIAFSGTYGAFKGYDPDFFIEDLDHRGFVLGVLAVM